MKQAVLIVSLWLMLASNALAEWRIEQFTDRMTDNVLRFANVAAKEPFSGVTAELNIGCDNGLSGVIPPSRYVSVQLSNEMPEGATISWRVDEEPVRYQPMPQVRSTSRSAIHALAPDSLRRAKRVRLQWVASTRTVLFYEFDVTGADKAIAQIPCGKARKN